MLRGHVTDIIHKSCHKQIMSLEFHIVARFANQHYNFNESLIFMLQGHVTTNWTKLCQKVTKSSEL